MKLFRESVENTKPFVMQLAGLTNGYIVTNLMQMRKEIGMAFRNLPPGKKCKYTRVGQGAVAHVKGEKPKFVSRCVPERFAVVVANLTAEQKAAACSLGFGKLIELNCGRLKTKLCDWLVDRVDIARSTLLVHGKELELSPQSFGYVMGISDGGMHVELNGDMKEVSGYLDRFDATSNGINIKKLAEMLRESKQADDEFKVIFTLFTLHSMLCPTGGVNICPSFLLSIKDVNTIRYRNWATFCFGRLMQGIMRYKQEKLAHIGGCLLYLQVRSNE